MKIEIEEINKIVDIVMTDQDVRDAYKLTGNGKTYAKYALYSSGGFDETKNNTKNKRHFLSDILTKII